jgi:hypothetical protein
VQGTASAISEFAQQITWMGASLRQHRSSSMKASYITPHIELLDCKKTTFRIFYDIDLVEPDGERPFNSPSWLPQFDRRVIVLGYPIASRPQCWQGLEMSYGIMEFYASGQGEFIAHNWEGGLVMQGGSSLLVLHHVGVVSLVWHVIVDSNGQQVPLSEAGKFKVRKKLSDPTKYKRHFVDGYSYVKLPKK